MSKSGRLFVNFPRWSDHYLNAVVEVLKDGSVKDAPQYNHGKSTRTKPNSVFKFNP